MQNINSQGKKLTLTKRLLLWPHSKSNPLIEIYKHFRCCNLTFSGPSVGDERYHSQGWKHATPSHLQTHGRHPRSGERQKEAACHFGATTQLQESAQDEFRTEFRQLQVPPVRGSLVRPPCLLHLLQGGQVSEQEWTNENFVSW